MGTPDFAARERNDPMGDLDLPDDLVALAADDPRAELLLARWDELAERHLAALAAHPVLGPRLVRMQEAEAWLGRGLVARRAKEAPPKDSPAAEELFDFARGPATWTYASAVASNGGQPLSLERRRSIEGHLDRHPEESGWVQGLQRRPPSPLLFDAPAPLGDSDVDEESDSEEHHPRRRNGPWIARWVPLAAAAAVLATGVLVVREQRDEATFPSIATLRGPFDEPLAFPRGAVLAAPAGSAGLFASEPRFEFAAVAGATAYRVSLRRHDGSAFDAGVEQWSTSSTTPEVIGATLDVGHFTWEAFATVNGLERSLGTLDFVVEDQPAIRERLTHESLLGQIQSLVQHGLATDARHRARRLPNGPQRARLLGPMADR